MNVISQPAEIPESEAIPLNDYFSLRCPLDWQISLRRLGYGSPRELQPQIAFRPVSSTDVRLSWHVIDWLEGQPEIFVLQELLVQPADISHELLAQLFPAILRVPVWFVTAVKVVHHSSLGWTLVVDYDRSDLSVKGRTMLAMSPDGSSQVQVIVYEGQEPAFSRFLITALTMMESLTRTADGDELPDSPL